MLKKLIKYDLKWDYKILSIFYLLLITLSIFTRLFLSSNLTIMNIIGEICNGATIAIIVNIIINSIIRSLARFKNNIYQDESYLTHTLPISKTTIFLSKFISSVLVVFTSIFIIIISLLIAYYSKDNLQLVKTYLSITAEIYNSTIIGILLTLFLIISLEFIFFINIGYIGLILGHKSNNHKMFKSTISGIIIYLFFNLILLITIYLLGLFNPNIMDIFKNTTTLSINTIKPLLTIIIISYTFFITICTMIANYLFNKGVDVE